MDTFKDAYVIVGYAAHGLYDLKPTPLSGASPGLEINAAALDNLLNGDFLREAPPWATAGLAASVALALAAATLFTISSWSGPLAILPVMGAAYGLLSFTFEAGYLLSLMTIATSALLSALGAGVYKYQSEGRRRRFIASVLSRYVSPKVVKQVLAHPEKLELGGEKKTATLLFSDLDGFTSIAEQSEPRQLVSLLNEYTTLMEETVTSRDGTLDKYIGDAVMAFWGAPVEQAGSARLAILTALECQEKMTAFAARVKGEGGPALGVRIGLNTGQCIIGNMGSKNRFDYTAIGDAVNQAARLEGLNKFYGTTIMASETTWKAAEGAAFGRLLDYVCVKGKKEPIRIYEVMALAGQETRAMTFIRENYESALEALHSRQWKAAVGLTEAILERHADLPSRLIRERAETCARTPPPAAWDGSFTHTSK
jgi:adenylate cyclase